MNLVVCPSRLFAVYLLSYVREFGNGRNFHFVVSNTVKIPIELVVLAKESNVEFISDEAAHDTYYDQLIVHSYAKFSYQKRYVASIKFRRLVFYADGLRNGFYGLPEIDKRIVGLIYFGYRIIDTSFENLIPNSGSCLEVEIVTLKSIENTWAELRSVSDFQITENFRSDDFLLVMRYWGDEFSQYEFKGDRNVFSYLENELSNLTSFSRLIFRTHPWLTAETQHLDQLQVLLKDAEFTPWTEVFSPNLDFPELSEPESVLWNTKSSPGYFFGFDSSLNVLVSQKHPSTQILWPDSKTYTEYFQYNNSAEIVGLQVGIMKELASRKLNSIDPPKSFLISGAEMQASITKMVLKGWEKELTQERDALTQERDALTQERDALTQERDALTQERDALTQERDALTQERDALTQERDALTQERDALTQERDALTQERDAVTQERDAVTQERDALTQERDAVTQERDAVTQERDAVTNSTIWRRTLFIRRVVARLRQLK